MRMIYTHHPHVSIPLSLTAYSELGPDHEWQTAVDHRTRVGSGCPMCSGVALSVTNSLAAVDELVASQWHPTNNGELTPEMLLVRSHAESVVEVFRRSRP